MIDIPIYSKTNIKIAKRYERIVSSERGSYYEIHPDDIIKELIFIPDDKKWKLNNINVYYIEFRTIKDNIKVYFQVKYVDYADYKLNMFYISVKQVRSYKRNNLISFLNNLELHNSKK